MLSRRENLLIRPWQQRNYENHRRKVQSAMHVVDNRPPTARKHVELKLKQLQKEKERCQKIENDNLLLLRKLSYIMKTSRVDNNWTIPQPNFLSRVSVYENKAKQRISAGDELISENQNLQIKSKRKLKCPACTPQKPEPLKIPEERVPWEPVKLPVSKYRSKSVPARKTDTLPTINEKEANSAGAVTKKTSTSPKNKSAERKKSEYKPKKINLLFKDNTVSPQSITVNRGALKLAVNFPSDAFVKFRIGHSQKQLMGEMCHCKRFTPATLMCQ